MLQVGIWYIEFNLMYNIFFAFALTDMSSDVLHRPKLDSFIDV